MGESICELNEIFGDLAARVPDGPPGEPDFIFHAGVLPLLPPVVSTDRIVFRKYLSNYNSCYRPDALITCLTPDVCRKLALFLLAAGFHGPREKTTLVLTHPQSDIRRLIIRPTELRLDDPPVGYTQAPFALHYYPAETKTHPWWQNGYDVRDLPVLALSNAEDSVGTGEEDWQNRDTLWLDPAPGTFLLAELLLNAGCSWNPVREYALEGDAGYRGVGKMSAELRILLPGSFGWMEPDEK